MRPFSPLLLRSGLTRVQCSYWAAGLSLDTQADVEETFLGYLHAGHRPMKRPFKSHPKQRKIVQVLAGYFFWWWGGKDSIGGGVVGGQQLLRAMTISRETLQDGVCQACRGGRRWCNLACLRL